MRTSEKSERERERERYIDEMTKGVDDGVEKRVKGSARWRRGQKPSKAEPSKARKATKGGEDTRTNNTYTH